MKRKIDKDDDKERKGRGHSLSLYNDLARFYSFTPHEQGFGRLGGKPEVLDQQTHVYKPYIPTYLVSPSSFHLIGQPAILYGSRGEWRPAQDTRYAPEASARRCPPLGADYINTDERQRYRSWLSLLQL